MNNEIKKQLKLLYVVFKMGFIISCGATFFVPILILALFDDKSYFKWFEKTGKELVDCLDQIDKQ